MKKKHVFIVLMAAVGFAGISILGKFISQHVNPIEISQGWSVILPKEEISALVEDDNYIWAGGKNGVFCIPKKQPEKHTKLQTDKAFFYVRALLVDKHNQLWIGHQKGVSVYDGENYKHYDKTHGLPNDWVTSIIEDNRGTIWAGTFGGAAFFQNNSWTSFTSQNGLLVDMVNTMYADSYGGIWFGSYVAPRGGLSYLHNNSWQYFSIDNGLPHNNVNAILEDRSGNMWIGTGFFNQGGAVKLERDDNNTWNITEYLHKQDGLAGEKSRSIFQDNHNQLWFGSENDGFVIQKKDNEFELFNTRNGLSDNEVKTILQDSDACVWIGTLKGITKIDTTAQIIKNK